MPLERPGEREFAELVADHVLADEDGDELVAVVDVELLPDELRDDRAGARPGLDGCLGAFLLELLDLEVQLLVDERAFFCCCGSWFFRVRGSGFRLDVDRLRALLERPELAAAEDELFAVLPRAAGDAALGRDARLADRVTATVRPAFTTTQRVVDRVHRLGTRVRANAAMAAATGLAEADVDPVAVSELADRRAAGRRTRRISPEGRMTTA